MRTLIIPDIHLKHVRAQAIIDHNPSDRRVFLGDIYDDFNDTLEMVRETALWHKEALANPHNVFIWGNHDLPYAYAARDLQCSGFTGMKRMAINAILTRTDWNRTKFFEFVDGYLVTHAGFHPSFPPELPTLVREALVDLDHRASPILQAGWTRGGSQPKGGITWLDWSDFEPYPGLKQIVGHTPGRQPRQLQGNWCIDTNLRHAAMVDKGMLEVFAVEEAKKVEDLG